MTLVFSIMSSDRAVEMQHLRNGNLKDTGFGRTIPAVNGKYVLYRSEGSEAQCVTPADVVQNIEKTGNKRVIRTVYRQKVKCILPEKEKSFTVFPA